MICFRAEKWSEPATKADGHKKQASNKGRSVTNRLDDKVEDSLLFPKDPGLRNTQRSISDG